MNMTSQLKTTGSCLCGSVAYECTGPLAKIHRCHCAMCRKSIGADFATWGIVHRTNFQMLKEDGLQEFVSSTDGRRLFCRICGCSVFFKYADQPNLVYVSLGTVDGDPGSRVEYHIYAKYKAPWVEIEDGLPTSDGQELLQEYAKVEK